MQAIIFTSNTGHTQEYAQMLGKELGLPCYALKQAKGNLPSGGCELNKVQVDTLNFTSTSGSAYAEIDSAKVVKIGSTSGSVNLKLNVGATIRYASTSGSFSCEKEHSDKLGKKIIGNGETIIDDNTTSGSLKVR